MFGRPPKRRSRKNAPSLVLPAAPAGGRRLRICCVLILVFSASHGFRTHGAQAVGEARGTSVHGKRKIGVGARWSQVVHIEFAFKQSGESQASSPRSKTRLRFRSPLLAGWQRPAHALRLKRLEARQVILTTTRSLTIFKTSDGYSQLLTLAPQPSRRGMTKGIPMFLRNSQISGYGNLKPTVW